MAWYNMSSEEIARKLRTNTQQGLSDSEINERLGFYGHNVLKEKKGKNIIQKFLEQFQDFMILVLLGAAGVSFLTSVIQGEADYLDPIIILSIVVINALLGIIQESKAEKTIEALKNLSSPHAKVRRNGVISTISCEDIVPGDIIILETGDYVPADARLIQSVNLKIEESALTGESIPSEKDAKIVLHRETSVGDRKNMVFASSLISYGRGEAIVVETGMNTEVGKIATLVNTNETPDTPLQEKLSKTGQTLGIAALAICAAIFVMGILRKMPPFDMFLTSVSLAVAAIPEGLPAIVTIMLAIGVQRMANKNAIIRKLPAVETLGSASVICSDKTGTLTQNKMTVMEIADASGTVKLHGAEGEVILSMATLCSDSRLKYTENNYIVEGDPTEAAIVLAAANVGKMKDRLDIEMPRVSEIPFESTRKLMSTIHRMPTGNYRIITKGAPDVLMERCSTIMEKGKITQFYREKRDAILRQNNYMADKALRVIAVAYRDVDSIPTRISSTSIEKDLVFCGLIGMIDPPRPEVKNAVKICKKAGIKPVMITGDHISTAKAIARELGIMTNDSKALTGAELNMMSDEELNLKIYNYSVFARVSPEHKVRIVKAFQSKGAVVAMTGDGVNDAPALQAADIGCAMGISGTDVAKGAADMVLTDDNFATIVEAVEQGRGIYDNIRKAVHFLLSCNVGEILTVFASIFFGWPLPVLAIQLLWVNLVTDSLPAIALGVDTVASDIMNRKPISKDKGLFSDGLIFSILIEGFMIGVLTLLAFNIGRSRFDSGNVPIIGRTMAFAVLSLSQLVHAFNMRSRHSIFKIGIFSNKRLTFAFLLCLFLQVVVIISPPISRIFKVVALNPNQWGIVALLSLMPLFIIELQKLLLLGEKEEGSIETYDKGRVQDKIYIK